MALASDIIPTEDLDLFITNDGDFLSDFSDEVNPILIIKSYFGSFKEFPLVGVGIDLFMASSGTSQDLKRSIQTQLITDGYQVDAINVNILAEDITYDLDITRINFNQ